MSRLELAVYETLSTPDTPLHVREIYSGVKRKVPDLCDDSIFPFPYCKLKHPLWQHKVRWALQTLKQRNLVKSSGRGYWRVLKLREVKKEAKTLTIEQKKGFEVKVEALVDK